MTFPVVSDRGTPGNSGNAFTHTPVVPAHVAGEVIVIPLGFDANPTVEVDEGYSGAGWTLTAPSEFPAASTPWLVIAWKIAESDSEVLRVNTSSSEASCYIPWVIDAGDDPELYFAFAEGTSPTPDPPNLAPAPGLQEYLVLAIFVRDNQGTATSGPSGYTNFRTEAGVSSGGVAMAVAEKEITAASENPAAFAVGNENWLACTIFVYNNTSGGVDTTPPTMNGAIEVTAYTEGGTGYSIAWPAATDNVAVDTYELSLNGGGSWADVGDVLTYDRTGGTVGATDQIRVRAKDAAGNVAAAPLELDLMVGGRYIDALSFKSNGTTDSDVKFHWDDATGDMPPRKTTLCIKWSKRRQQTGFYAEWWRMPNLDATYGNVVGDTYAGFHPYPCDGNVDPDGTTSGTTGSGVSTHFAEIAGLPNRDIIGSAALESHASVKGEWVADASFTEVNGSNVRHRYYPDIFGDPDFFITVDMAESSYDGETNDTDPHLMFGAPTWTVSGSTNPETPAGEHRGYRVFDTSVSGTFTLAEMQAEALAAWNSTNAPATSKGTTGVWYINDDPTPSDISDKSGEGHDPAWGNARRPDAYQEIVAAPVELGATAAAQSAATAALQVDASEVVDLAAAGAAQVSGTAELLKGVSLAAAGVAVTSGSGVVAHAVPLEAAGVAVAVAGAQMSVAVTLGGAALATAAAAAGLQAEKILGASGSAQAGGSATLSTSSDNLLAADGAAQSSASASLSVLIEFTGAALVQAAAIASLAVAKRLGASGAGLAGGSAGLQVGDSSGLSASAQARASAGAALWLDIPLGATALAQVLSGASMTLSVPLAASALANAHASALLSAPARLHAHGQATAMASARLSGTAALGADGQAQSSATASLQVTSPIVRIARAMVARNRKRDWTARNANPRRPS